MLFVQDLGSIGGFAILFLIRVQIPQDKFTGLAAGQNPVFIKPSAGYVALRLLLVAPVLFPA